MNWAVVAAILWGVQDVDIERALTLTGGSARVGCWLPVEIGLASRGGFDGRVAVVSGPMTVSRAVRLAPGERVSIVVPGLPAVADPVVEIQASVRGEVRVRRRLEEAVRFLGDEERLVIAPPHGWREVDPRTFEAVDVMEGESWTPPTRFGVVEPGLAALAPDGPWVEAKRRSTILFLVVYVSALFGVLVGWPRPWRAGVLLLCVAGMSVLFSVVFFVLFPRGRVAVEAWAAVAGDTEYRLHFVRGGPVTYAHLAKPLFDSHRALVPVEVALDGGCTLTGASVVLTTESARPATAVRRADPDDSDVRFFLSRLGPGEVLREEGGPHPLSDVCAVGLVEARVRSRLIIRRK
ncbi:MAG: hypothetical protein HYY16_09995 [Planctomycetes bacterium]|nr:hypothetical protein [Planctomycetota bacterium]